jgi:hypothetical protein
MIIFSTSKDLTNDEEKTNFQKGVQLAIQWKSTSMFTSISYGMQIEAG